MIQGEDEGERVQTEIQAYRQRNQLLRKKLKEKDLRIMQLFEFIDQAGSKITHSTPHYKLPLSPHHSKIEHSVKATYKMQKLSYSQAKRQKRSTLQTNKDANNIFKQQSSNLMSGGSRRELKLPALDKRTKLEWIYPSEDSILENPEGRPKLVRIPMDRLKPLNSKEVKKRFLMKFQRRQEDTEFS